MRRFKATDYRDTVVLAGFGRFGQSILDNWNTTRRVRSVAWRSST